MLRLLAINAAAFLLPFAVYAAWLVVTRGTANRASDWPTRIIGGLAFTGAVLALGALLALVTFSGAPPGGTYRPAIVEDGQIVPGRIE